jgi:alkaline phosphatase D
VLHARGGLTRRGFLGGALAGLLSACTGGDGTGSRPTTTPAVPAAPRLRSDPFTLGVASGDPLPSGLVLWTRLVPDPGAPDGGMPDEPVDVRWQIAVDDAFSEVVASGITTALPRYAHSVHVDVDGLAPGTTYHYRFDVGDRTSPTGRTRTAPAADAAVPAVRLAVANCQAYQSGFYSAYRHIAEEEVDAVCFLGDYIYELEASREARVHGLDPPEDLAGFRALYGVYKSDPDLQAAHAAHPWIVTWDDHEVEDNYGGLRPGAIGVARGVTEDAFRAIRAAAYQAFWEHVPLRGGPPGPDGSLRVYRDLRYGDLVTLAVLDDRQYRSPLLEGEGAGNLPRGLGGGPLLPGTFDESRTMLGDQQERWLHELLRASTTTWNVLVQQTVMAEVDRSPSDPARGFSMDAWDGYVAARERVLATVRDEDVPNLVSLGGDIHAAAVLDLYDTYRGDDRTLVGSELIGPSITSIELIEPAFLEGARSNPHVHLYEPDRRGYLVVDFARDEARGRFRFVSDALDPDATVETASTWVITAGSPGAVRSGPSTSRAGVTASRAGVAAPSPTPTEPHSTEAGR